MVDVYPNSLATIRVKEPDSCGKGFLGLQKSGSSDWKQVLSIEVPLSIGTRLADRILFRKGKSWFP